MPNLQRKFSTSYLTSTPFHTSPAFETLNPPNRKRLMGVALLLLSLCRVTIAGDKFVRVIEVIRLLQFLSGWACRQTQVIHHRGLEVQCSFVDKTRIGKGRE